MVTARRWDEVPQLSCTAEILPSCTGAQQCWTIAGARSTSSRWAAADHNSRDRAPGEAAPQRAKSALPAGLWSRPAGAIRTLRAAPFPGEPRQRSLLLHGPALRRTHELRAWPRPTRERCVRSAPVRERTEMGSEATQRCTRRRPGPNAPKWAVEGQALHAPTPPHEPAAPPASLVPLDHLRRGADARPLRHDRSIWLRYRAPTDRAPARTTKGATEAAPFNDLAA